MRRVGIMGPMFGRDLLHPLDPDRIVDMAKYVDVGRLGGDLGGVGRSHLYPPFGASLSRTILDTFVLVGRFSTSFEAARTERIWKNITPQPSPSATR